MPGNCFLPDNQFVSYHKQGSRYRLYFHFYVLWWALRSLGVEEWAVRVIQGMYTNVRSRVRISLHPILLQKDFTVHVYISFTYNDRDIYVDKNIYKQPFAALDRSNTLMHRI